MMITDDKLLHYENAPRKNLFQIIDADANIYAITLISSEDIDIR